MSNNPRYSGSHMQAFLAQSNIFCKARTYLYEAPCRVPKIPSINTLGY